jgi:hypothetical protein
VAAASVKIGCRFLSFSAMAKIGKTGDGYLNGALKDRSQFQLPNGHWAKRNTDNGEIMNVKHDHKPFKSVRKEK